MRTRTTARVTRLTEAIGAGCPQCLHRPTVHLLGEDNPVPKRFCPGCGRRFADEVYVYLGIDPSVI